MFFFNGLFACFIFHVGEYASELDENTIAMLGDFAENAVVKNAYLPYAKVMKRDRKKRKRKKSTSSTGSSKNSTVIHYLFFHNTDIFFFYKFGIPKI